MFFMAKSSMKHAKLRQYYANNNITTRLSPSANTTYTDVTSTQYTQQLHG